MEDEETLGELFGLYRFEISTGKLQSAGFWNLGLWKVFSYQSNTPRPDRSSHPQEDPSTGCPTVEDMALENKCMVFKTTKFVVICSVTEK